MSKRLVTFTDSLSSLPLVTEGNGGWILGSRLDILTNGSAVFIDCANERKKEEHYEQDWIIMSALELSSPKKRNLLSID